MIKGRKIVGFLKNLKMVPILIFLFILFATSSASAGTLTADPISGSAPLLVTFTYTQSENVISLLWNFGDGTILSTANKSSDFTKTHTYYSDGTKNVELTETFPATNANNTTTTTTNTIETTIYVSSTLLARFESHPSSGETPLKIRFEDTSDGDPTRWLWDFGDDSTSNDQNPTHTYTAAGSYKVKLTVWKSTQVEPSEVKAIVNVYPTPVQYFTNS